MESDIIRFYSGTTQELNTVAASNYIAFDQTTKSLSWCHNGTKYSILAAQNPDWNVTDPSSPAYIKNKPAIEAATLPTDLSQFSDETYLAHTVRKAVPSSSVDTQKWFLTESKRRPSQLITPNTMYSIQTDSLALDSSGNYKINLSRYLAYQNTQNVPASGWYLLYNGGPV